MAMQQSINSGLQHQLAMMNVVAAQERAAAILAGAPLLSPHTYTWARGAHAHGTNLSLPYGDVRSGSGKKRQEAASVSVAVKVKVQFLLVKLELLVAVQLVLKVALAGANSNKWPARCEASLATGISAQPPCPQMGHAL
jgi:hypothetical protein